MKQRIEMASRICMSLEKDIKVQRLMHFIRSLPVICTRIL